MQWRLMSYDDTQRYRIGPNFATLPINRPRSPVRNIRQDGCAVLPVFLRKIYFRRIFTL